MDDVAKMIEEIKAILNTGSFGARQQLGLRSVPWLISELEKAQSLIEEKDELIVKLLDKIEYLGGIDC